MKEIAILDGYNNKIHRGGNWYDCSPEQPMGIDQRIQDNRDSV